MHLIEVKNFGNLKNIFSNIRVINELRQIEKEVEPDIIHLHSSIAGQKYGKVSGDMKNTDYISDCLVRLPLFFDLTKESNFINSCFLVIKSFPFSHS